MAGSSPDNPSSPGAQKPEPPHRPIAASKFEPPRIPSYYKSQPQVSRPTLPAKARTVKSGVKLARESVDLEQNWAAARWMRTAESFATGDAYVQGLEYAKLGQTRHITIDMGTVVASVQGRQFKAYTTSLTLTPLASEHWDRVVEVMVDQARYAAKILAGEMPPSIEDIFGPLGLRLFPGTKADPGQSEVQTACTCPEVQPWCKHAVCLAWLVAERLAKTPMMIFQLRGLPVDELLDRLRQRRTVAASALGAAPVYTPRVAGASESQSKPLEECVDGFWTAGAGLHAIPTPIERPAVTHPLLRRLGPSPFTPPAGAGGPSFPLVGLLATCYDVISQRIVAEADGEELPAAINDDDADSADDQP